MTMAAAVTGRLGEWVPVCLVGAAWLLLGAWFYDPRLLRSAYRSWNFAANQSSEFGGFRVARTLHP